MGKIKPRLSYYQDNALVILSGQLALFTLLFVYAWFVSPTFEYLGFSFDFSLTHLFIAVITTAFLSFFLPQKVEQFRHISIIGFFLAPILPIIVLFIGQVSPPILVFGSVLSWMIFRISLGVLPSRNRPRENRGQIGPSLATASVLALGTVVWLTVLFAEGTNTFGALGTSGLYQRRALYYSVAPGLLVRTVAWTLIVASPILLYGGWTRHWGYAALAVFSSLTIFYLTGFKKGVIIPILVPALLICIQKSITTAKIITTVSLGLLAVNFSGARVGKELIGLTRRVFFTPAMISVRYFEFYGRLDPLFFRHTGLNPFASFRRPLRPSRLVAEAYGFHGTNMNAGWIGDSVLNLGIIGLGVYPVLIAGLIILAEWVNPRLDETALTAVFGTCIFTLINSPLNTIFLTQGYLVALLLAIFCRVEYR